MIKRRKNKAEPPPVPCALSRCVAMISGAWTANIIWYLSAQPRRYSELKSDLQGISAKVLSARLKRLEAQGLIARELQDTSPPTVEYFLTPLGQELKPAIEKIVEVGHRLKQLEKIA